jgi:FAD/FMN-containing dehydrogenase
VFGVDQAARTADVGGMTTYEDLVAATLRFGLLPLVVPQLKTITLGGAVTGLGIEASSFRNGLPHESVLEAEVLTGAADIVVATPDNEHSDLYFGFPNSYGTVGYALRLRIELEPAAPYVHVRHRRFTSAADAMDSITNLSDSPVDFLDGVAFSPEEIYLTVGTYTDTAWRRCSDYTGRGIYYRSIREQPEDVLTCADFIWRWDPDWFWCSRAFGAQHPLVRTFWPRRYRRSDVYWKLLALDDRLGMSRTVDRLAGRPPTEKVIQDVQIPVDRGADFLKELDDITGLRPVWLCPVRQRDPNQRWPLYPLDPGTLYVNFGFWGGVRLAPGEPAGTRNRRIECAVADHGGAKSLYSTAEYDRDEFAARYGGDEYVVLKKKYDPDRRLLDLYDKAVLGR